MQGRLLPGDKAPGLKLAKVFNGEDRQEIQFDRPSVVLLWNAGCAGCLPAVTALAEQAAPLDAACFGVAVLVRDEVQTAQSAAASGSKALLALEERPAQACGTFRGAVTREWLEASGRNAIPTVYVVDGAGTLAWIGEPDEAADVLRQVVAGEWDVGAARTRELQAMNEAALVERQALAEITDALVAGRMDEAVEQIGTAERVAPALAADERFATMKLDALARVGGREAEAAAHYAVAAGRFRGKPRVQAALAQTALQALPVSVGIARIAGDHLREVEAATSFAGEPAELRLVVAVQLAHALQRNGEIDAAEDVLARAQQLVDAPDVSARSAKWARAEIVKLRELERERGQSR